MNVYIFFLIMIIIVAPPFYFLRRFLEKKTKFYLRINNKPKIKGLYNFLVIFSGMSLIYIGNYAASAYILYGGLILAFGFGVLLLVCMGI